MSSVSSQNNTPSQASNSVSASQSTPSYASTAKKAVSSPPVAAGSSTPSPAVAVGGSAPGQQHGKTSSASPVNGKPSVPPAVPAVAHGSTINGGSDHSRKASVTINASNASGYIGNGGPVGGSKSGIQFGSLADSPAVSHSTPQITHPTPSAPIAIPSNPRVTSPAQSPSPIPQPSASGGRPPSGLAGQGNGPTFGSLGGDGDRHMRQASNSQGPLAPNTPQGGHLRRESSQSTQSDLSNQNPGAGRGGFQQGGRGRGGYNQYQQQQQMGFPPNQQFRNSQGPNRGGMVPPFQPGRPLNQFPNSPHQAARSPALANSIPNTPNMNQAMPMQNPQQYNGYYNPMPAHQVHHPSSMSSDFKFHSIKGKHKKYRGGNEKSSYASRRTPRDTRELFGHSYTSEPAHSGFIQGQGDVRVHSVSLEHRRSGFPPSGAWGRRIPSTGQIMDQPHTPQSHSLPPLPPPLLSSTSQVVDVKKMNLSPESPDFENFLTVRKQNYHGYPPFQPNMPVAGGAPFMYPQMQHMGYMNGPPPGSPQSGYQQPYMQGQYAPQAQPMSRNSSQISEQRPASSMGGPQTPSMAPSVVASHTPQQKTATTPSAFVRPKKSSAIVIKRPDGDVVDIESLKTPASPAPVQRTRTPPVIASTPTPPPKVATPQHNRTESAAVSTKSKDQIQKEIRDKVAAAAGGKDTEAKEMADEAARAAELKLKEEEKAKQEAQALADAKAKEEAEAKAAAEKAKQDEEDELERQIREMEEAEAEREKKEAELMAKRAADKAAADKKAEEERLANAEENDRKLREAEREMERLEDEKERKRAEAESKANGGEKDVKDDKATPATPNTIASKLSSLSLGGATDSGASTPVSDDSMGPPPPKVNIAEKRAKPAALNLAPLNTKPVEPPQPSAALQSLKSARFLTVMNSSIYPEGIASPNPALNNAVTTKGKSFKYDKEFLLQFQKVFTEKPSLEFESQIKSLIGDGDGGSARTGSIKTPGGMGSRQNSTRNQSGAFNMGSFGAPGGDKTLPAGTTSAQRYAMSNGTMPRPAMNPMSSFNRPGGAFPTGTNMSRSASGNPMNNMPHSPRQQSNSRRERGGGGSRRPDAASSAKAEAQAAKTMPLTAGMEIKAIQTSATGWKPRSLTQAQSVTGAAGPAPGAPTHMDPDMVQRKVKSALNKMTPEKFDKIADQILAIAAQSKDEQDGRTLRQVIQLTFEKATDEAHWASMYAKFCKRMLETMSPDIKDESILDKNGNVVSGGNLFRKYLLNRCQEEFERGWKIDLPEKPEGERGEEKSEEAAMLSDEYYIAAAAKRRGLGLVQFIGELYKLSMLTERIMHECVKKLVDYTGVPDEAEVESLTKLLKTIGANLDSTEKGKPMMDVYFARIQAMIDTPELPSRLKFMLMDIVDLRKARWVSKEANKGPKTLDEIKAEAEALQAAKAAESARNNQRGGRMQIGRGDSRNFSGGYGNQPPIDHQKNTVGMDDLRRLTNKNAASRQASQQMSFGPTSMFSSRSNSGRKLGPGGAFGRTGDDSGPSSRTGTPPQQKEKETTTSSNAFSLLAGLGSGEENPASPPSANTSPVLTKSTPAAAEKTEDKDE